MKSGMLCAAALMAAPAFSVATLASEPEEKRTVDAQAEENEAEAQDKVEGESAVIETPEVKAEEKRICRRVKLDMSSRRATRVCKTKEEWRLFNQRR